MSSKIIHISIQKLDYKCPHCNKIYKDEDDKMLSKLNKTDEGYLVIKCKGCSKRFGYAVDMRGSAVGFEL